MTFQLYINSRFQLHEFTISTSQIHGFNFTNSTSRIQLLNSWSWIHEVVFVNSWSWIREFVKLKSWNREVEFMIRKVEFMSSWSWIREVEIVNWWSWNREFVKLKIWINEVEMPLPVFRTWLSIHIPSGFPIMINRPLTYYTNDRNHPRLLFEPVDANVLKLLWFCIQMGIKYQSSLFLYREWPGIHIFNTLFALSAGTDRSEQLV